MHTVGLDRVAALAEADRHRGGGRDRLRDIALRYSDAGKLTVLTFDEGDREAFLDIAWQEIDASRALTPTDLPRTLRAVAARVYAEFGTFSDLVARGSRAGLDAHWFEPCAAIEHAGFRWGDFLMPWIVPSIDSEKRHSPQSNYYIWEGVHSTAVLALALMRGDLRWQPVSTVLCLERPS
jgi:hypothetical protein